VITIKAHTFNKNVEQIIEITDITIGQDNSREIQGKSRTLTDTK